MKLTAENVHTTFMECLFSEGESTENYVLGEGCITKVGFHPERLKGNETNISEMLNQLPDEFKKAGGGGMSFLNMCNDKDGNQWSDLHQTMDELVTMGIASEKASFLMRREMWSVLPGGMPYVVVL
jgi:hypothetical protein